MTATQIYEQAIKPLSAEDKRPGIRTKRVSSYDRSGGNNDFV